MSDVVISVEGLSKQYRLGQIGARTLNEEIQQWWRRMRGRGLDGAGPVIDARAVALRKGRSAGEEKGPSEYIWALKDVSFNVRRGEVLGIIGRNGAGKSTLLKILTRITDPTAGRAVLHGKVASLLEVGTGFHPELTGRENVYLNGAILGMRKRDITRQFDEIVDFSEVGMFIDTPVKRYSSGMYVRLAFAVAAHLDPEILLVDEVLAVGDLGFQRKCLGKMERVARGGRTVLFVSHNMAAIQSLCTRAILLGVGRLEYDGDPASTVSKYIASVEEMAEKISLEAREDREGGREFRFTDVVFRDGESGVPLNILMSGRPVVADIGYVSHAHSTMNEVVPSISFATGSGAFLSACRSDAVGKTFQIKPGRGRLICRIPKLPLSQGRFLFNLIAYRQGVVVDWLKEAGAIDVSAGDYYGTGRIPASALQSIFIDYNWESPA